MQTSRHVRRGAWRSVALGLPLLLGAGFETRADAPAAPGAPPGSAASSADTASDEPKTLPQDGLFSSIKQSLRQGDQEVIRGHFDLGTPPNVHRYYCLVDPKTHRREPNGVLGDPLPRPDGMTGIKSSAVSLYRCDKAEQQGLLITSGYVLPARSGASTAGAATTAPASAPTAPAPAATAAEKTAAVPATPGPSAPAVAPAPAPAAPAAAGRFASGMIDVSGLKLGMSPDQVKAVLKSKGLHDQEWSENLSYREAASGRSQPIANGRFVSIIAASSAAAAGAAGHEQGDAESFEVMFTPVPGRERAMAIVHSVGYSPVNAVHESALESGLIEKYGGYPPGGLPQSPTWLYRSDGKVTAGDDCGRRALFGGLGPLRISAPRENVSLEQSESELRSEAQHCGVAMVTEDHHTSNGGALRADRMVDRYTVTAYGPALAAEGAARAEEMIRTAGHAPSAPAAAAGDSHAPDL